MEVLTLPDYPASLELPGTPTNVSRTHRIADKRVLRLIRKWLAAGVVEDGSWSETVEGSPQGASVSPLLANVYLHYVFDLWVRHWRRRRAQGDVIVVRFADDGAPRARLEVAM